MQSGPVVNNPWLFEKPSEVHKKAHLERDVPPACSPGCFAFKLIPLWGFSGRAQHAQFLGNKKTGFLPFLIPACFSHKQAKLECWRDAVRVQIEQRHCISGARDGMTRAQSPSGTLPRTTHASTTPWRDKSLCHRPEVCLHNQYVK